MKVLFPEETAFGSEQLTSEISLRETLGTLVLLLQHVYMLCFFFHRDKMLYNKEYLLITLRKYIIKKTLQCTIKSW